ncbi:MAG: hypothetical protein AAF693_17440 [Bacteroidota bacterium]
MFLKKGNNALIVFLSFTTGAILSYIASQYHYFKIKTEFNVIELLLSLATIVIGLYIALILQKNRNRSQNFYKYVEGKYDVLWEEFIQFSSVLELSTNVELKEISRWFKVINQKLTPLIKVFDSFDYDASCLTKIEEGIDELEDFLSENSNIQDQILDLSVDKAEIIKKLTAINELFAKSFKDLNNV